MLTFDDFKEQVSEKFPDVIFKYTATDEPRKHWGEITRHEYFVAHTTMEKSRQPLLTICYWVNSNTWDYTEENDWTASVSGKGGTLEQAIQKSEEV